MIVLDTSVLVWLTTSQENLSAKALKLIKEERREKEIYVSSISLWEIALLVRKKRLAFNLEFDEWFSKVRQLSFLKFIDVDVDIAVNSVNLELSNNDPADRIIIASAKFLGAQLVTSDKRILEYEQVQSVW